jgi:hypothetical protein
MSTALFLCFFGSEVRQFSHSGVISRLLDAGWQVVVLSRFADADMRDQFDSRARVELLPAAPASGKLKRLTTLLDKTHAQGEQRQGKQGWIDNRASALSGRQHAVRRMENALAYSLLTFPVARQWAASRELALIPPLSEPWLRLLADIRPTVIVSNLPRMDSLLPLWNWAVQQDIPIVACCHTRKITTSEDRLIFPSVWVGTWNEASRIDLLRQNPALPADHVQSIGCTHFSCVGRQAARMEPAELRRQIGAQPDSRLLLYCAAAPYIVQKEARYVELLLDAVKEGRLPSDLEIVVRTNPVDQAGEMAAALKPTRALVAPPDWHWDSAKSWGYQRKPDQRMFNSLLCTASVCIGLSSTISVECAVTGLPVINLGFLPPETTLSNRRIEDFWQAEFNADVRQTGAALLAADADHLLQAVRDALTDRDLMATQQQNLLRLHLGVAPEHAVQAATHWIQRAAASHHVEPMG